MADAIDDGMDGPSTQMVVCWGGQVSAGGDVVAGVEQQVEVLLAARDRSRCARMIFSSQPAPSRHGVHWPHDSRKKNLVMRQAARTAQVWSSITTTEPEPSMEPAAADLVLAEGQVDLVGPEPRGRDAAGDEGLQLAAVGDAAAEHRRRRSGRGRWS